MEKFTDIDFRCEIENETEESVEMYLYGAIVDQKPINLLGEEVEGDFIYPKRVRDMVNEAGDKDIELHINSKGGQVFASVPIHNFLKQADNYITAYVDGIAASGASVIVMGCDEIVMPDNTNMMIHEARGSAYGTADDMLDIAERLEKINESVINNYNSRFKGSKEELKQLLSDETWLTADEAVTLGFADRVMDEEELEDQEEEAEEVENNTDIKANLLAKFGEEGQAETEENDIKNNLLSKFK